MSETLPLSILNNRRMEKWVRFQPGGTVKLAVGKVEIGQAVLIALTQIAAEELDIAIDRFSTISGDTADAPDEGSTSSSQSIEMSGRSVRLIGAELRARVIDRLARRLNCSPPDISVDDGAFLLDGEPTGHDYWNFSTDEDFAADISGTARPKDPSTYKIVGKPIPRRDLKAKISGAGFIHDIVRPRMLHARILRQPSREATLESFDEAAIRRAARGDFTVVQVANFVAFAGEDETTVQRAAVAAPAHAVWKNIRQLTPAHQEAAWYTTQPSDDRFVGDPVPDTDAGEVVTATYSRPFVAHAAMAPSCGLAEWRDGHLQVWSHTQGVYPLRNSLAEILGLTREQITVRHAHGAGCYGHNGADDAAIDAAILARAAGRPVRLQWSRADEFAWSPLGSAMSIHIDAGLDAQGRIVQWQHDVWSHSHVQRPGIVAQLSCLASTLRDPPAARPALRDFPLPAGGGQRNAVPIYAMPSRRIAYHLTRTPVLRTSALRALGAYANVFAIESCMDELAALAGQDPLAFRLAHLDDPRAVAVLQTAAAAAGWQREKPPALRDGAVRGRGLGLARYKNSSAYCAVVVELEVTDRIVLDRIWVAVDAGEVVHPDGLVNQIEGGVLQAASWTLKEAVQWDAGDRVTTRAWADYPILNFDELPRVLSVEVIAHPDLPPLGVGECAAGPTAGAIGNALADALGVRARHLPLTPERLMTALQRD